MVKILFFAINGASNAPLMVYLRKVAAIFATSIMV